MPKFYTSVILLIIQSKEICEKQFSVFGSKEGQISPLMNVPVLASKFFCLLRCVKRQRWNGNHVNTDQTAPKGFILLEKGYSFVFSFLYKNGDIFISLKKKVAFSFV